MLDELKTYMRESYFLLEKIKNEEIGLMHFWTSRIVISEVFSVIGGEFRSNILLEKGVPLRYWIKMIDDTEIPEEDVVQIQEEIDSFVKIFFNTNKIYPLQEFNSDDVGILIWGYNCDTHDALVLAQAIKGKCKYFITEDQRLRRRLKNMNEFDIKLYPSDRYLREIFK